MWTLDREIHVKPIAISANPARHHRVVPEAHRQPGAEGRRRPHAERHGEKPNPGRQRAVAVEELEVHGDQEDEPEQREEGHGDGAAGGGEPQVREQADVEHRLGDAPLPRDERDQAGGRGGEAGEGARRSPAAHRRLDDRVDEQADGDGRQVSGRRGPGRGGRGSRDVGTQTATSTIATAATGAIAKNTLPHQKCSRSQPPTIGPKATPIPTVAPHTPIALARSTRSVNTLDRIDSVLGKTMAAPTPITARAAISWPVEVPSEPAAVPIPKTARPVISAPLRPNRSLRLPAASTKAQNASW